MIYDNIMLKEPDADWLRKLSKDYPDQYLDG